MEPNLVMVFDVESVGLHGEGFAVGWLVVDFQTGKRYDQTIVCCPSSRADGFPASEESDRRWVSEHVDLSGFEGVRGQVVENPKAVRRCFWEAWTRWRSRGAWLAADCTWPVEARFLVQCVEDNPEHAYQGPYPLLDIASVLWAWGRDPLATNDRLDEERPEHNPLADARQSARLLIERAGTVILAG